MAIPTTRSRVYTAFGGIGSSPAFYYGNRLPYAENYELSYQRQLTSTDLLSLSYVGTQGHRLLSSLSANPGSPALCLATPGCGPGLENNIFINGTSAVIGTRPRLPGIELTPAQATAGVSSPIGTPAYPTVTMGLCLLGTTPISLLLGNRPITHCK